MNRPLFLAAFAAAAFVSQAAIAQDAFTQADFDQVGFLEGRWTGTGPDGRPFFDLYDRPEPHILRSRRYPDATFSQASDESRTTFESGAVVSRWGPYSWTATSITADRASFAPMEAPSSFSWTRVSEDVVEVEQRFTGPDGTPQSYVLTLTRVR